ncbi:MULTISPECIES: MFS transporter [unclassified Nonomuraea]|uniref:MFS transporter n=1 Tax=unclassified Nonomuraea TaxID=2593643 RepID=UPI00340B6DBF
MVTSYRRLLIQPGVPFLLAVGMIVKLSTPVLSLALLLAAVDQLDSYAAAGFVLIGHALALALCAPLGGRLADRHGARPVLAAYLAAHAVAYGLLLSAYQAGSAAMVGAAVLLGATTPPVGAVIRGSWPRIVPPDSLPAAYAADNAVNEVMFILGPLLVPVLMLAMPTDRVVAAAGACLLIGTSLMLVSRGVRQAASVTPAAKAGTRLSRLAGPLSHRPTLVLLILAAFGTFSFGCLRIATVAAATKFGSPSSAGVLMGLLSAGALVGALGYGSRTWPISGKRLLIVLSLADGASMLAGAFAPEFLALAVLIAVIGLLTGPRDAVQPTLLAEHAPARYRTEVFAWLNTFMWTGYGLGTAIAGQLTGLDDSGIAAFVAASAIALASAFVAAIAYRPTPPGSGLSSAQPEPIRPDAA